jgi:aminopeptidase-like protein
LATPYISLCEDDGGEGMYRLVAELYPIFRSVAGDGVRATLDLLRAHVPMTVHEVRSGLQLFDRPIPHEWSIRDACIKNKTGKRVIESGYLTWGEFLLRGRSLQEVLISCHIAHPALRNENPSGIVVAAALAQRLLLESTRYSYRFLFIPGPIGSTTWLELNRSRVFRIRHSLLLDCLGDSGNPQYRTSSRGDAEIDHAVAFVLNEAGENFPRQQLFKFGHGSSRSPGFDLPADRLRHAQSTRFSQCNIVKENPTFVEPSYLHDLLLTLLAVVDVLENNHIHMSGIGYREGRRRKRDLKTLLGRAADSEHRRALVWVLNSSDGSRSLLDIARAGNLRWDVAKDAARVLVAHGLITSIERLRRPRPARKPSVNRKFN